MTCPPRCRGSGSTRPGAATARGCWPTAPGRRPSTRARRAAASERDRHVRRAVGRIAAAVQQRLTTADRLLQAADDRPQAPARPALPAGARGHRRRRPVVRRDRHRDGCAARRGWPSRSARWSAGTRTGAAATSTAPGGCLDGRRSWSWRSTGRSTCASSTGGATCSRRARPWCCRGPHGLPLRQCRDPARPLLAGRDRVAAGVPGRPTGFVSGLPGWRTRGSADESGGRGAQERSSQASKAPKS